MISGAPSVQLHLPSTFDHLELIQLVSDRLTGLAGFDEDAAHWVGVSIRESVINAVKHGNRERQDKHVTVNFQLIPVTAAAKQYEFVVEVLDEGEGFEPEGVGNPLDPENILKSSGRGIFFMRNFMDDVVIARRPEGGMSVRMSKRVAC